MAIKFERTEVVGWEHAKYRRMITVYVDITAPLYWWKEFDTYKVGTVANSCSTMGKITAKEFTLDDFSYEHLIDYDLYSCNEVDGPVSECAPNVNCGGLQHMNLTINVLNYYRHKYLETKDKNYWWQMIQLLPSSYNQKRTIMLNYKVLNNIYHSRKDHRFDEWREFCKWIESLPHSEIITGPSLCDISRPGSDHPHYVIGLGASENDLTDYEKELLKKSDEYLKDKE